MPDLALKSVSASQAAALFNASRYTTRWALYQLFKGVEVEREQDNRMDWGKRMQPLVLQAAAEELHFEVIPNLKDTYIRRGLLGCTRDAEIICPDRGPGALETKAVFDYRQWMEKWDGGKAPPREYEIQLQVQMYVGDGVKPFEWGVIAAWCGGEMHYFERKPDLTLWAMLEAAAQEFFDDLANNRAPEPFGDPSEHELLAKVFLPSPDIIEDFRERTDADALAQDAVMMKWHGEQRLGHDKAEKALKTKFQALMKDAGVGLFPHGIKVQTKRQSRAGYTVKPTSFNVTSCYVPDDVPYGRIEGFDKETGNGQ